jgi:NAD-dependent dihydropyrimidine dehydrogenase PreA subunit
VTAENISAAAAADYSKSWGKAALYSLPMLFLSLLMSFGQGGIPGDLLRAIPFFATVVLINVLFFLMMRTGKTDRYRAVFFITMAVLFVISFVTHYQEVRGSMALTPGEAIKGRTPFCHMVIPTTLIPAVLSRTIIFPGTILGSNASIASMIILWIGASLALGRGFCSWGCFFGGLEDGFSRVRRKPWIRKIADRWTYLPYAVLAAVVILSAVLITPFYCVWLCPFKTVTEYFEVNSFETLLQVFIFVGLFLALVVVLPILSGRRTQCGLFCPMGAFQSFTNKVNPFEMQIDRDRCKDCGKCVRECPTFSMDAKSVELGRTRISCMKCGKCVDECPTGAIAYHVKGTLPQAAPSRARLLFLYPAFLFLTVFGFGMIQDGLYRILLLATTGSMIK